MNKEEKNYLGIDWGKSDVGIALASDETKIAFAYATLKNDKHFIENLVNIIEKENIGAIVIGIPSYINQEEVVYDGEKLGKLLKKKTSAEIFYQNEMFSTQIAQKNLIEQGIKKIKRFDDQESARIILEDWLNKKRKQS